MTHQDEYASSALDTLMGDGDDEENFKDNEQISAEDFKKFIDGEMTWGELQGLTVDDAYAIADIGYKQLEAGKLEPAQAIFEGLVVSNPYDAYFHKVLGAVYAKKKMHVEAEQEFSIAIDIDAEALAPYVFRAEVLLQHGELERAMADLKKAISLDREGTDPNAARARALASATSTIVKSILENQPAAG
ncbi:MAG: hypothetical protein GY822_24345 [Deltaproteobacteria bacterium]|nr:hypothetical protein [Deltaproteobacteria bacterium]